MTDKLSHAASNKRLKRAIRRLVNAEVAKSWMGSQPPEDYKFIEKELTLARNNLNKIIDEVVV